MLEVNASADRNGAHKSGQFAKMVAAHNPMISNSVHLYPLIGRPRFVCGRSWSFVVIRGSPAVGDL